MKEITVFVPPEYEAMLENQAIFGACQGHITRALEEVLQEFQWMQIRSPNCFNSSVFNVGKHNRRARILWRVKNKQLPTAEELENAIAKWKAHARARITDPDTSKKAAARFTESIKTFANILKAIYDLEMATGDNVAKFLGINDGSVTPRMKPLVQMGFIEDSGWREQADGSVEFKEQDLEPEAEEEEEFEDSTTE